MNAEKGGAAVLWGVQKIKGRRRMGRACRPMDFGWAGSVLGSGQKRYIRVITLFLSFF